MPKYFVHPVSMTTFYVDTIPFRDAVFCLAPHPDTIGSFESEEAALQWIVERKGQVIEWALI